MSKKKSTTQKTMDLVAPAPETGKPGPKPKMVYNQETLDKLRAAGRIQCTVPEVAAFFGCSERTVQSFFAEHPDAKEAHEEGKLSGLTSLRRYQFRLAEKNSTMAIWLGKQLLNQREPVQQIETGKPGDFSGLTDEELQQSLAEQAKELADLDPEFAQTMLGSPLGAQRKASRTRH